MFAASSSSTSEHAPFLHQVAGHNNDTVYFRSYRRRLARPRRFVSSSHLHASDLDDDDDEGDSSSIIEERDGWSGSESDSPSDWEDAIQVHVSTVLKPLPSSSKGLRERCFYEYLTTALRARRIDLDWIRFFPRYYGALYAVETDNQTSALLPAAPLSSLEPFSSDSVAAASSSSAPVLPKEDFTSTAVVLEPTSSPSPEVDPQSSSSTSCEPSASYLHLEDLTACYAKPSLIDVKIGVHSYDPFECARGDQKKREKVRRENEKCPSQLQTGFRICGARVWNWADTNDSSADSIEIDGEKEGEALREESEGDYKVFDKYWCRSISLADIEQPFWIFFGHTPSSSSPFEQPAATEQEGQVEASETSFTSPDTRFTPSPLAMKNVRRFLPCFIERLCQLRKLCLQNPKWRFYASSLLLCYETPNWNASNQQLARPSTLSGIHIIDFGHAYPIRMVPPIIDENGTVIPPSSTADSKIDANYLHGIESLEKLFRHMLHRAFEETDPDVLREEQRLLQSVLPQQRNKERRLRRRGRKKENQENHDATRCESDAARGNPSHCIPRRFSSLLSRFIVDRCIVDGKMNSLLYDASQNPHLYLKRMPQLRLSTLPSNIRKQQLKFIIARPLPATVLCHSSGTARCVCCADISLHSFLQSRPNLNMLWQLKLELVNRFDDGVNTSFERPKYTIEDPNEVAVPDVSSSKSTSKRPKHPRTVEWRQKLITVHQASQNGQD